MTFQRPPNSAAEIAALPTLGSTQCEAHVRAHGSEFTPETLVYLLRQSSSRHDTATFELCGQLLLGREGPDGHWHGSHTEGVIVNLGRSYGFYADDELMRDFRAGCFAAMWQAICSDRPFWEVRFGLALREKCIEVARSMARQRKADARMVDPGDVEEQAAKEIEDRADPDATPIDEVVLARLSSRARQVELLAAVRRLPERQGRAALLAWAEARPIEGAGSVARVMGISPRAVYKLLTKAKATLQSDPALRAIWFGESR